MTDLDQPRAVIHVGAPKTGSTYLQHVLWSNRDSLLSGGVEVLGAGQAQHYRAGKDLRGIPFDPEDPGVDWTGAWERMATRARQSEARVVVITDEHLAAATAEQARRAADSLAPRRVDVVYVTRDLVGLLPSEWQEFVKHGSTLSFDDWVRSLLDEPDKGPGAWFWKVQDPVGVVTRWSSGVPVSQIHVVPMPPTDGPRDQLWSLFAETAGIDAQAASSDALTSNPSLGLTATEVLRRVNQTLPSDFPVWHRTGLVRDVLANEVLNPLGGGGRPTLTADVEDRVLDRARRTRDSLTALGCDIVGTLPDVIPPARPASTAMPDDREMADAAVQAIAGLMERMGRMRDDRRRAEERLRADAEEARAAFESRHPLAVRLDHLRVRVGTTARRYPATARLLEAVRRPARPSR